MRHRSIGIVVALASLLGSPAVLAGGRSQASARRHDLRANFGYASAVGFAGVTYGYIAAEPLELEAGIGWGYSGLQLSLMPKLSSGSKVHKLVLGVGPSLSLDPTDIEQTYNAVPERGVRVGTWLNAEVGYSFRPPGHWSLMIAFGLTAGLGGNMHSACMMGCDDAARHAGVDISGKLSPQFRIASGWWF